VCCIAIVFVSSCGKSKEEQIKAEKEKKAIYNLCVSNGVEYFKEMGSYPILKYNSDKGKHAITVAKERCKRAPKTAFSK
jgi:hypothetical protein